LNKTLLQNRKRTSEMSDTVSRLNQTKKEELLNLKLQALEGQAVEMGQLLKLSLSEVTPDPHQPRKTFKNIEALAHSIKEQGLLQPLLVKKLKTGQYQIVVGERRFRAANLAGLTHVPAILREQEDADTLILQLLENDQRDQVSPLEEAEALDKLIKKMNRSKQEVAHELGRDAAWVSLRLGLLDADPRIKNLIKKEKVLDLRTLHELRKLSEEEPALFKTVLQKMESPELSGGYRQLIREVRHTKHEHAVPRLLNVSYQKGKLSLLLEGKRKPLDMQVDAAVLKQLKSLIY